MSWPIDLSYSIGQPPLFERIIEFLEDEAENRAASGSEMSDYECEPRKLAEELRGWLESIDAPEGVATTPASDGEASKPKARATEPKDLSVAPPSQGMETPDFLKRQTGELPPAPMPVWRDEGREGSREGAEEDPDPALQSHKET